WSDNDRYFGPFTWSYSKSYPHWAVVLKSRGDDDDVCTMRFSLWRATLIVALPPIVRPWREKVYPGWDAATVARLGRDWYWSIDPRKYGFRLSDGHLSIYYGRTGGPSMDSSIQQRWGCFLPWTQWRHVRHSLHGLHGEHFWTEPAGGKWAAYRAAKDACPAVCFALPDSGG